MLLAVFGENELAGTVNDAPSLYQLLSKLQAQAFAEGSKQVSVNFIEAPEAEEAKVFHSIFAEFGLIPLQVEVSETV